MRKLSRTRRPTQAHHAPGEQVVTANSRKRLVLHIPLMTPGQMLQMYLMASYLYYELDKSIIPDSVFDALCKALYGAWDSFDHQHKHLVDRDALLVVTGYGIKYPLQVQHAALAMLEVYREV